MLEYLRQLEQTNENLCFMRKSNGDDIKFNNTIGPLLPHVDGNVGNNVYNYSLFTSFHKNKSLMKLSHIQ